MSEEQNNKESKSGFFENLLTVVGGFSGAVWGYNNGGFIAMLIVGVIAAGIGRWVGAVADGIIAFALLVFYIMLNAAVRRFFWDFIQALFQ